MAWIVGLVLILWIAGMLWMATATSNTPAECRPNYAGPKVCYSDNPAPWNDGDAPERGLP